MSLTRVTGQYLLRGPIITITLPELPAGYSRDQEMLLQIPVQVKLRARSAEAPEEGRPPEVPEGKGQRTKRLKAQQPATEAASLPLACALETPTVVVVSAVVPPPIRDPLETPTPPSLIIRTPTLETATPILAEQIGAEQAQQVLSEAQKALSEARGALLEAGSSGGVDPGQPAGGVPPSAAPAIHETVLPSGLIEVQESPPTHDEETAAGGARPTNDHVIDPTTMPPDDTQQLYDSHGDFIG